MKNTNYLKEELYELIKTDESIFDFIQESSLDGLWYWDLEQPEEEWMNPKFWSVLGYDHREMPHKASAWQDIIHPEDLKIATDNFIKHCKNPDHPYDQTVRYTHKNGSTVWIRCRGLAIRDNHGKPLRMLGAHQEITDSKNKELLLKRNTAQLRNAQQVSKIGSWELDLKTNEVFWTEELYKMYGFNPTLPPPPYPEHMKLFTPESWEVLTSSLALTREQGIPYELELTTIRNDGSHGWMWVGGEALFDENKNIIGLNGVAQDISEKKILELEKEALLKRLNYALDASGDGIWDWTPADGQTVYSKAWVEMLGYEVGELASLASEWSDRLHPDDAEWVFAAINKVIRTPENGDIVSHEYRFRNKAGDYLWILNKAKIVERNEKGEASRVVGTHTNITERKQAEEALRHSEAEVRAQLTEIEQIYTYSPIGLFIFDREYRFLRINERMAEINGYSVAHHFGKTLDEIAPDLAGFLKEMYRPIFEKGEPVLNVEIHGKTPRDPDNECDWIGNYFPLKSETGEVIGLIGAVLEITDRKLAENELKLSNSELEQFAYVASHDLQEPLRMVISFLSMLEKKYGNSIDDKGKEYIGFAIDGAQRMRQIILDLLEYSKVGRTEDNKEELDLNKLVDEIKILLRKKIEEKQSIFIIDELPKIYAYRSAIRQVFQNLISNALKYSNNEIPVQIHITVKELEQHWQFAVIDNGIGIEKENFDKIFIIFQRLHSKGEYQGTGLGLAIIKKIIEMQGGKIWVESEEGKGSTFYFTIKK